MKDVLEALVARAWKNEDGGVVAYCEYHLSVPHCGEAKPYRAAITGATVWRCRHESTG